ncbi:MAG: N-acetylmuramoyl-L-alanine amidase [Nitrosopumilus sp.]
MTKFKQREETNYIIVHISDSPQGRGDGAVEIDRWHRERGFDAIGYHYVILEDGTVEQGRPVLAVGAHCRADGRNHDSIGICLIGHSGERTVTQLDSLQLLISNLSNVFGNLQIHGHSDFDENKEFCPGFKVCETLMNHISRLVKKPLGYSMSD